MYKRQVVGTILPTDFTQQQPEIWVKFSETMRAASLVDNFKVFDALGNRIQGAVEILYSNTVAIFRPTVAFGLGQEYRIDLAGMEDFAANDLVAQPIAFRRAAPQVLADLATDPALFDALARCRDKVAERCFRPILAHRLTPGAATWLTHRLGPPTGAGAPGIARVPPSGASPASKKRVVLRLSRARSSR